MRYLFLALLAASLLSASAALSAPAPKLPPPKKLDRVRDPSPELLKELYKFDSEYRHGSEERFAELETRADELAKRFPEKDDQARIWYEVAHVAAQSGIDKHAVRVRKYASKCLEISRDPLQRGRMYSYLASAVNLSGTAFAKGRRDAVEILLTGYVEMLAQELPETAPELPAVNKFDIDGDPAAEAQARAQHAAQMTARREAEFTRDLIERRDTLVMQFRDLFKPEPNYHGRSPEGPDELRVLANKKLTEQQVKVLLEKVTK
jgi:hypothetical protein